MLGIFPDVGCGLILNDAVARNKSGGGGRLHVKNIGAIEENLLE